MVVMLRSINGGDVLITGIIERGGYGYSYGAVFQLIALLIAVIVLWQYDSLMIVIDL